MFTLLTGCTVLPLYYPQFVSRSPRGTAEVRVIRNFPGSDAEYRFRIEIRDKGRSKIVFANNRGSSLGLLEANWSSDGKRVALLICNWNRPLLLAFDVSTNDSVDPSSFRVPIELQIRQKYHDVDRDDVLRWACTQGSFEYKRRIAGQ